MKALDLKRVRVLVNRKSGLFWSFDDVQRALDEHWGAPDRELVYQFTHDVEDGRAKVARAVEQGVDLILVVGGDGTISSVGRALVDSDVCLGTIPTGSGNGLARHFEVPLAPGNAARALAAGTVRRIDVGMTNAQPFFITCSMAWDAALVRSFNRMPVRGILPYVFAGVYEFFEYRPQPIRLCVDEEETLEFDEPLVCTVANLSEYGGGAVVSPEAQPDDGLLDLVVARRQDVPMILAHIGKMIDGGISSLPKVVHRRFSTLTASRPDAAPVQVDGELVESPAELRIDVKPRAINILVPTPPDAGR